MASPKCEFGNSLDAFPFSISSFPIPIFSRWSKFTARIYSGAIRNPSSWPVSERIVNWPSELREGHIGLALPCWLA
jgi:hypothetical protein